jgi:phenylalanyl-tRNA synthetase beta chain
MLMICDTEKPIAIAGVMGGQNSEIDENTTNVVLESAFFNPSSIRRTAKTLGLQTDASYRFERGCDIDMAVYALDKAAQMITELAGGEILDGIVEFYPRRIKPKKLLLRFDYARKMIGADIDNQEMRDALHYLGFGVPKNIGRMKSIPVFVPTRRVDVSDEIDLIEEIARIYNYDRIESDYQSTVNYLRDAIPPTLKPLPLRNTIREYLAHSGYTELLTPNIIDPSSAALTCQNPIRIENPLGEEMSVMRPSMIPPVLKVISFNLRQGNDNLKLFETGKVFIPQNNIVNSFVADIDEREEAVIALVGNDAPRQWSRNEREYGYFDIKGDIVALLQYIRLPNFKIKSLQEPHPIFDENSGELFIDGEHIGYVGGINKNILQKYEIEVPVFIASIDLTTISDYQIPTPQYMPVSPYPVIKRDLAFLIDEKYTAREVLKTIKAKASRLLTSVNIFDVYNGKGIPQGKRSIGFELTFSSNERTLVDTEVEADIKIIIEAVKRNFEAELRDN